MAYFDHNATSPLHPAARAAWLVAQDEAWQNPGGAYRAGARVRALLERERERFAALLGTEASRLVVTSGATEAANAALARLGTRSDRTGCILTPPTEHSCIAAAAQRFFRGRVEPLPVDRDGVVEPATVQDRLARGGVAAVAVMAANNETGVLQPWREIAAHCAAARVPYVCDATQWLGRMNPAELATADYVFGSAHKFGGPKGVGFLLVPAGEAERGFAIQVGGGQQRGLRAGTEDWPGLAAMVAAFEAAETSRQARADGVPSHREQFERELVRVLPGARIVGAGAARLWNTAMVVLPAGESNRWIPKLDRRGFQVSTTAACASGAGTGSAVLRAVGYSAAEARRALRFSAGWETTEADWLALADALVAVNAETGASGPVVG